MNDQLHHLLDGELPDGQTAEFLRRLAEDPAARALFRQQMKLNGALYRNAGHGSMTTGEAGEMLDRLETAMGRVGTMVPKGMWRRGAVVAAVVGAVLLGGGLGYATHEGIAPRTPEIVVTPISPTIRFQIPSPPDLPEVSSGTADRAAIQKSTVIRRSTARRSVRGKREPQAVTGERP